VGLGVFVGKQAGESHPQHDPNQPEGDNAFEHRGHDRARVGMLSGGGDGEHDGGRQGRELK